jgi:5-methylthioadenosine/S-adenosylhomocysteine deaminase
MFCPCLLTYTCLQMACHKSDQAMSPFLNFQRMGLLSPSLIAAHMTTLSPDEIALCGVEKVNIAHCPTSNLKLASGFCPVHELREAGANVAIGTDGTCSNNTLDMFAEMKLASVLAKGVAKDATSVPAIEAVRMATINGAKALGLESRIGSVVAGKEADLIAVSLTGIESVPMYDVVSHIVYATTRDQVTDVWVAGKQLLKSRALTTIDEEAVKANALVWQAKVSAKDDQDEQAVE